MWIHEKQKSGMVELIELNSGSMISLAGENSTFGIEIKQANGNCYYRKIEAQDQEHAANWLQKLAHRLNALDLKTLDVVAMPSNLK